MWKGKLFGGWDVLQMAEGRQFSDMNTLSFLCRGTKRAMGGGECVVLARVTTRHGRGLMGGVAQQ